MVEMISNRNKLPFSHLSRRFGRLPLQLKSNNGFMHLSSGPLIGGLVAKGRLRSNEAKAVHVPSISQQISTKLPSCCCSKQAPVPHSLFFISTKYTLLPKSFGTTLKVFASRKPVRKQREVPKNSTPRTNEIVFDEYGSLEDRSSVDADFISVNDSSNEKLDVQSSTQTSSRNAVLQACIITSGLLFASGMAIRQVSHIASTEGWMTFDSSTVVSFDFEIWHLELITGLVVLISSCRYLLLKAWPDFAESSEAANQQVLSPLQPLDYMIVAFLPGISEELLFRGALLPLFGLSWMGALAVGAIFGALHLGSGRKYSFAIWATFVGFAYGFTTIISSSVIVPMAAHSLNNLVGGIWWRYTSNLRKK